VSNVSRKGLETLPRKRFDGERAAKTIEEICGVSEFVDAHKRASTDASEIERYLRRSKRRLTVVSKQFKQINYKSIMQEFPIRGSIATNALFVRGDVSDARILIVGHHDYCAGLGAEDNATALAMMLELGRCLEANESRIMFASFDLEELGLLGSRHFVATLSRQQLQNLSCVVALECLGSGRDVVICQAVAGATSNPALVSELQRAATKSGHRVFLDSFGWFNSDHVPFAERGIRTVEICSYNSDNYKGRPDPNVNVAHSNLDVPENIRPTTLEVIGEILLQFIDDL